MLRFIRLAYFAALTSGCAMQLTDPVIGKVPDRGSDLSVESSNEIDNNLTISRITAYPFNVQSGGSSLLSVEYMDVLGRPVGVSWMCDKGILLSNKGSKVSWVAPEGGSQTCDCEATVRSRSGIVKATVTLIVK